MTEIISHGNLIFLGSDDKKLLENAIAPTLLLAISKQISNFCNELPNGEFYCLSWRIHKGPIFKNHSEETNNE